MTSGNNGMSRTPEGVSLVAVCSAAIAPGGKFEAFGLGGVDVESSGVDWHVSLGEVSVIP